MECSKPQCLSLSGLHNPEPIFESSASDFDVSLALFFSHPYSSIDVICFRATEASVAGTRVGDWMTTSDALFVISHSRSTLADCYCNGLSKSQVKGEESRGRQLLYIPGCFMNIIYCIMGNNPWVVGGFHDHRNWRFSESQCLGSQGSAPFCMARFVVSFILTVAFLPGMGQEILLTGIYCMFSSDQWICQEPVRLSHGIIIGNATPIHISV